MLFDLSFRASPCKWDCVYQFDFQLISILIVDIVIKHFIQSIIMYYDFPLARREWLQYLSHRQPGWSDQLCSYLHLRTKIQ